MTLNEQINSARHQVHTDAYPMSIGEMINLYNDGEIEIHPEFQRVYRWSHEQKCKLIESILLGIPLPSIFVSQRDDGVWDVVDGLQRLSTIFSFLGVLKDENGELCKPLVLSGTRYLPLLEGKVWEDKHDRTREIDIEIRRVFKREKIDLKIIKRESEGATKFELFQRLNTGGSKLSDQEVRNCMLLMLNKNKYEWIDNLVKGSDFIETLPLSYKQNEECYNHELALRFIVQRHYDEAIKKEHTDVGPYLNAEMNRIFSLSESEFDFENEAKIFTKSFEYMNYALGECAFKKYNQDKNKNEGAVSIPVFEALSVGLSKYLESNSEATKDEVKEKIITASQELTRHSTYIATMEKSIRPLDRMVTMSKLGQELIS